MCVYLVVDLHNLHEDTERQKHQNITDESPAEAIALVQRDGRNVPLPAVLLHIH